jgi:hypothetical protein
MVGGDCRRHTMMPCQPSGALEQSTECGGIASGGASGEQEAGTARVCADILRFFHVLWRGMTVRTATNTTIMAVAFCASVRATIPEETSRPRSQPAPSCDPDAVTSGSPAILGSRTRDVPSLPYDRFGFRALYRKQRAKNCL